jgi:hypothetical protein
MAIFADPGKHMEIRVKHVYRDAVYLEGGSSVGFSQGLKLKIKRGGPGTENKEPIVIAEVEIESVTLTSSAGRILSSKSEIVPGISLFRRKRAWLKYDRKRPPGKFKSIPRL